MLVCGRFALAVPNKTIIEHYGLRDLPEAWPGPRYNIAPGQSVLAVAVGRTRERSVAMLKWGLIPHWAKDEKIGYKMINARSETVWDKPAFRRAVKSQRCLIPVSGFFEWDKTNESKQPYYLFHGNRELFSLAGLWEIWKKTESDRVIHTCTVLTTTANSLIQPIHDRMPVIIEPEDYDLWLESPPEDRKRLESLCSPLPADTMQMHRVSRRVNKPVNDDSDILEESS